MTSGKIPSKDTPTLEDLGNTVVDPLEKLVNYFNEQDHYLHFMTWTA